jgi:hypothetical protein
MRWLRALAIYRASARQKQRRTDLTGIAVRPQMRSLSREHLLTGGEHIALLLSTQLNAPYALSYNKYAQ